MALYQKLYIHNTWEQYTVIMSNWRQSMQWRSEGGGAGGGGHGPRAQALEGAPAQLIGANFKKKIRPRQIIKVTSLQCRINLAASFFFFFFFFFFFSCCRFCPQGRMQDLPNGGGGRTPSPKGASRVGLCGRGRGANSGGEGRRCKHWPPGAGDPRYATESMWSGG